MKTLRAQRTQTLHPVAAASRGGLRRRLPTHAAGATRCGQYDAGLTDDALVPIGQLDGLIYLQTFGNQFTDRGVQQLAALTRLESLYLEEETLSAAAFEFAARLPHLSRLGVQDVSLSEADLADLRLRLPYVRVG
jgi:hypothetical protein